ncbi:MAG: trigger factor, partial [Mycobacteriales bacterium]
EAITGLAAGESGSFPTTLVVGEFADREAQVLVTVRSVKRKSLPDLNDDFATTASEFDTLAELREDSRRGIERVKRLEQGLQARDRALQALVERTEVPLPESVVAAEIEARMHTFNHQLEGAGLSLEAYLQRRGQSREEFDAEIRSSALQSVQVQLVLDAIAAKEQIVVNDAELVAQIVRRAQQAGKPVELYALLVANAGQLPAIATEVMRGRALAFVLEQAQVSDTSGHPVDLTAVRTAATDGDAELAIEEPPAATD